MRVIIPLAFSLKQMSRLARKAWSDKAYPEKAGAALAFYLYRGLGALGGMTPSDGAYILLAKCDFIKRSSQEFAIYLLGLCPLICGP